MEDKATPILPAEPIEGQYGGEIHINVENVSSSPEGSSGGEIQLDNVSSAPERSIERPSTSRARKSTPPDSPPVKKHSSSQAGTLVRDIGQCLSARLDPLLLLESAGMKSCCIFKVPDSLVEVNPKAYTPKIVSIGPYHYGEKNLQMIQEHKLRFVLLFLNKTREKHVEENALYEAVWGMKEKIRNSYSKYLKFGDSELVAMMILDGIFILTLLLIKSDIIKIDQRTDPIFTSSWIIPSIRTDLLLLENQVPFFILETLFAESQIAGKLENMAFDFFNLSLNYEEKFWKGHENLKPKHLLDLLRKTFLPRSGSKTRSSAWWYSFLGAYFSFLDGYFSIWKSSDSTSRLIFSAKNLRVKGIRIEVRSDAESKLDIRLRNNTLYIPQLRMDGFITSFFLNCVAFEQLYNEGSSHITSYVVFMGNLLHNEEDAVFLSKEKIIENYFGNDNEVSQFFKTITEAVVFNLEESYLKSVCEGVNDYISRWYSGTLSGLWHTYFESPWTFISTCAVAIALFLAWAQAYIAYRTYKHI